MKKLLLLSILTVSAGLSASDAGSSVQTTPVIAACVQLDAQLTSAWQAFETYAQSPHAGCAVWNNLANNITQLQSQLGARCPNSRMQANMSGGPQFCAEMRK